MNTFLENLQAELARLAGCEPAGLAISLRPPLDAQSNRLYDVRTRDEHWIAKEYLKPDELEAAARREYRALQLLSALDVAPQPVFYDPAVAPVVVYRFMEGDMWDRRRVDAADLARLLGVWLKVQAVPVDWLSRGSERSLWDVAAELRRHFLSYQDWTGLEFKPAQRAAGLCLDLLDRREPLFRELVETPAVLCFCRSDPRFANVIERPGGRLGLVDWEDCGRRDPAREVVDLVMHPNQEDLLCWQDWQAFLTPFLAARRPLDPTLARRMQLYLGIFPLFWLMLIQRRGLQVASSGRWAGWQINGMPANARLRRYLARALAWPVVEDEGVFGEEGNLLFFPEGGMGRDGD